MAINEINNYTDIRVSYKPIRENRRIIALKFSIDLIDISEYVKNTENRYYQLDGKKEE